MRCRRVLWVALLGLAVLGPAWAQQPPTVHVKILAFNDFHGNLQSPGSLQDTPVGGIDVLAAYVADIKSRHPHSVVVSAGDLVGASPLISAFFHDEGTIETMNRLGLEFNAVGNHEFDEGKEELVRLQRGGCHPTDAAHSCQGAAVGTPVPFEGARFSFLAANVVDQATGQTLFAPYGIKRFDSVQVAFIGMTLRDTPTIVVPSGVAGLTFQDEADTVNALVPRLRAEGVEAIVVLVHQGGVQTTPPSPPALNACEGELRGSPIRSLVSRLDDAVDLVISGHTHAVYNCRLPNKVDRLISVTSAQAFGRLLTDIDLQLDARTGHVLQVTATNVVVDRTNPAITPAAAIQDIVNKYSALVAPLAQQVIGSITQDVPTAKNAACALPAGALVADAQWEATKSAQSGGAQLALMNPGGVRARGFVAQQISGGELPGDVTYGEAFTVQPFGNSLVTMTLTAQQLKDVLEQQFADCQIAGHPAQTVQRILQPSQGVTFTWDLTAPVCRKIVTLSLSTAQGTEDIVVEGVVRQPTRPYRVTVNSFLADGGDGFTVFKDGTSRLGGAQDLDALIAYFARFQRPHPAYDPTASAHSTPRIRRADGGTTCP